MYEYKLKLCPNRDPHDWTHCIWAHDGEVARRRNPSVHSGNPCVEYEKMQACPRGDRCPYAHGVWERGLHPQRYRTSLCSNVLNGGTCNRKICFFAHGRWPFLGLGGGRGACHAVLVVLWAVGDTLVSAVRLERICGLMTCWLTFFLCVCLCMCLFASVCVRLLTDPNEVRKSSSGYYYTAEGWMEKTPSRSTRKKKGKRGGGGATGVSYGGGAAAGAVNPTGILSADAVSFSLAEQGGGGGVSTGMKGWKSAMRGSAVAHLELPPIAHNMTWAMWAKTPVGTAVGGMPAAMGTMMWGSEGDAVSLGFSLAGGETHRVREAAGVEMAEPVEEGVEAGWIDDLLEEGQRSGGTTPRRDGGVSSLTYNNLRWGAWIMGVAQRRQEAQLQEERPAREGGEAGAGGGTLRNMFADFEQSQAAHGGWFAARRRPMSSGASVYASQLLGSSVELLTPPEGPGAAAGRAVGVVAGEQRAL